MKSSVVLLASLALCGIVSKGASPVPDPKAVVLHGHMRVTILSDSLVRIEASNTSSAGAVDDNIEFDDRATLAMVNRLTDVPKYSVKQLNQTAIQITLPTMQIEHNAVYSPPSKQCSDSSKWQNGTDQTGGSRSPSYPEGTRVASPEACCDTCASDPHCTAWVFSTEAKAADVNCYPMGLISGTVAHDHRIFGRADGSILTPDNFAIRTTGGAEWRPGTPDSGNLNGTARDDFNCANKIPVQECIADLWDRLTPGLISILGWTLIDDSATPRFDKEGGPDSGWHESTFIDESDWYFAAYDSSLTGEPVPDYRRSLQSFAEVSGRPALPLRGAFLPAYSHYYPYGENIIGKQTLAGYKEHGMPLGVLVSDLFWHEVTVPKQCNPYGGYMWNQTLWPDPNGYLEELHGGKSEYGAPLYFTVNVHPQMGVDPCQDAYLPIAKAIGFDTSGNKTIPCDLANSTFSDALMEYVINSPSRSNIDFMWTDYGGCSSGSSTMDKSFNMLWTNIVFARQNQKQFGGINALQLHDSQESNSLVLADDAQGGFSRRPMVLSRFGGLGNQRTQVGFSGDTHQCMEVLEWQVAATPMASNVLFTYWSSDIGGFKPSGVGPGCSGSWQAGNNTQGELYLRWIQFGAFNPIMRTHCTECIGRDTFAPCTYCERHAWKWPDLFGAMKDAFVLRGMIQPFLYSEGFRTYQTGTGAFHSMYVDYPNSTEAYDVAHSQYMMGTSVIVAPAVQFIEPGATTTKVSVWLPEEQSQWVAFDGSRTEQGSQTIAVDAGLDDVPAFVRAGTLLPLQTPDSSMNGANATAPDTLLWTMWLQQNRAPTQSGYELFEDDGVTVAYQTVTDAAESNVSTVTSATASVTTTQLEISIVGTQGTYEGSPTARKHWYNVRGFGHSTGGKGPSRVEVDGKVVPEIDRSSSADFGFFVVDAAAATNQTLSSPEGTLVVRAGGAVPVDELHSLRVTF